MNLIVDIGNTRIKIAIFNSGELIYNEVITEEIFIETIANLIEKFKCKNAIISSVGILKKSEIDQIKSKIHVIELNSATKIPFINNYATPKTLGVDRIALVAAAVSKYKNQNVLIIDAGTCITFDFITDKKEYLGGAISPGIRMRYKALHHFTANLPLLETKMPKNIVGDATATAMHSGVVEGVLLEIDGAIQEYKLKYPDLTIILTGGDANFLSKQLKSSIFANSNFLLEGLNFILQYNIH
jgi:type III pantothenate kinase